MSSIPGRTMCSGIFPIICFHYVLNFGFYARFLFSLLNARHSPLPPGGRGGGTLGISGWGCAAGILDPELVQLNFATLY